MTTPPSPGESPSPSESSAPSEPDEGRTPEPTPGSLEDPNGQDISREDTNSARRKRTRELNDLKPPPPDSGGGFDIRASHVYYTAELLCDEQFAFYSAAIRLSDDADQGQAAGKGEGPDAFAAAYDQVAKLFLEVWGRSIRSIGGVSVGLTQTANQYQASDWYANRQQGPPPRRELPSVLGNIRCKPVSSIKWTGTGDDSDIPFAAEAGNFPDLIADLAGPAIKEGLRLGKTHDITPGADAEALRSIGGAWHRAGEDSKMSAKNFADIIRYLTDDGNSEWQAAMNGFCQSIWGTTAWGEPRNPDGTAVPKGVSGGREWRTNPSKKPGERQPIIEVLQKTADAVKKELEHLATVRETTKEITSRLGAEAAKATARDLTDLDLGELTRLVAGAVPRRSDPEKRITVLSQGAREYFRLSGARTLLAVFGPGVPDDAVQRNSALAPLLRGFSYAEESGGRNLYEVADQLRTAADLFDDDPAGTSPALKNIPHAIPQERTPTVLRDIATYVEEWNSLPWTQKFSDVAATTGELMLRFPRLSRLLPVYFGQDGVAVSDEMSGSSAEEQIAMVINDVHPACPWHLPGLAGECHEALVLFRNDEETMDRFFSSALNGGSGTLDFVEFFPALAQACLDHVTQSHPPLWEWQGA